MSLRQSYAVQHEIPEMLREHYTEKDGRFILVTEPPTDDVTGIKSALDKERGARRDAEKQLGELKIKFEGIDPEEVPKLKERVKMLDDQQIYDRDGIEALVLKRTQSMKDEHARVLHVKDREITQLKQTNGTLDQKWREDRIKTTLHEAAQKAGVWKFGMPDAIQRGLAVFTDLDERGNAIAKQGEDVRYGKDGVSPLTPEEWYGALKPDAPHLWPPSSGNGTSHGRAGLSGGVDYSAIVSPTERLTAFRQAQRAQKG